MLIAAPTVILLPLSTFLRPPPLCLLHYPPVNLLLFPLTEMQMRVKFRQESGLVDLSGTRHSGGERAVATVMYLMALQDLTSAPFRVVDGT